jgi:hypothetical protein
MIGKVSKFAGKHLLDLFKLPGGQFMSKGDLAMRLAPDIMFGGLEATMTPGDYFDKVSAGVGSALGGSLGGLALGKLGGRNQALATVLDMAGSIGGDMGGRMGAEQLQRGKDLVMGGKGQTAYERLSTQDREALEKMIREDQTGQVLAELGLLPGSTQGYLYGNQGIG